MRDEFTKPRSCTIKVESLVEDCAVRQPRHTRQNHHTIVLQMVRINNNKHITCATLDTDIINNHYYYLINSISILITISIGPNNALLINAGER